MTAPWICRRCAQKIQRRSLSTYHIPRNYPGAIEALNSLQSNYEAIQALYREEPGWHKWGVPKMIRWARRIGYEPSDFDQLNPIHIAGTKGKGSTSTFISSILSQYLPSKRSIDAERLPSNVGLYTSPHLRYVRERIQINNKPISEEMFARYFWQLWDRFEATPLDPDVDQPRSVAVGTKPVYFHYLTLMAFHCFLQEKVGTAIVECGIGGEYDTTNILVQPSVTGITNLGLDHEMMLGYKIEDIAWHKAGIFKPNVPAFSVLQPEGATKVLLERAEERNAPLQFVLTHPALEAGNINLGLKGAFQKQNASLAIAISAQHLQSLGYTSIPSPLEPSAVLPEEFVAGLESASLGGRCEVRRDPKVKGLTWYIDGAHTLASIEVAAQWFASAADSGAARVLILNQQSRDAGGLAKRLYDTLASALDDAHPFQHAIFCVNRTTKTGYKADMISINTDQKAVKDLAVQTALAKTWDEIDPKSTVYVEGSIEEAIDRAREISGGQGRSVDVLVTGSLHLIGGLIDLLESEAEKAVASKSKS